MYVYIFSYPFLGWVSSFFLDKFSMSYIFSFVKNKWINLRKAYQGKALHHLFHLSLSEQAYNWLLDHKSNSEYWTFVFIFEAAAPIFLIIAMFLLMVLKNCFWRTQVLQRKNNTYWYVPNSHHIILHDLNVCLGVL